MDPLAEKRVWLNPYNYCQNNPILRFDPNGLTDYKVNKKTGKITIVGKKNNDEKDRILRTDKNGNVKKKGEGFLGFLVRKSERGKPKVAIKNISKGILKEGLNLKENTNHFNVNGIKQPTLKEFNYFISKFSDFVGKEIAGIRLGNVNNSKTSRVLTYKYKGSTRFRSETPKSWFSKFGKYFKGHFHTHPYNNHTPSKDFDLILRKKYPKLNFYIISGGYEKSY